MQDQSGNPSERSIRPLQRALAIFPIGGVGFLLWFAFVVFTPYMYQHPVGPQDASFALFMVYKLFPLVFVLVVTLLMICAWSLATRGRLQFRFSSFRARSGGPDKRGQRLP